MLDFLRFLCFFRVIFARKEKIVEKNVPTDRPYLEVPWARKTGFLFFSFLFFWPYKV